MKKAFTLAEVLVTLGIIGVVAAMTIPTLINNYKKKVTVERLKSAYSVLFQALRLSEAENGYVSDWNFDLGIEEFYDTYLTKYLKHVEKIVPAEYTDIVDVKYLNGLLCTNEEWCGNKSDGLHYWLKLANGTVVMLDPPSGRAIAVDINGDKKPNIIGKDIFVFSLQDTEPVIMPFGMHKRHSVTEGGKLFIRDNVISDKFPHSCNKSRYGQYCAGLIMLDNWEIKNDYPW